MRVLALLGGVALVILSIVPLFVSADDFRDRARAIVQQEKRRTLSPRAPQEQSYPKLIELCDACHDGDLPAVNRLLTQGADRDAECPIGPGSCLVCAAFEGQYPIVLLLLNSGAEANCRDAVSRPILYHVVRGHSGSGLKGRPELALKIADLLISRGADVNAADDMGITPLMEAAARGDLEMALFLIKKGADINARTRYKGTTALSFARQKGHRHLLRALVDLGAK